MTLLTATSACASISPGAALCIQSGSLRRGDRVHIALPGGELTAQINAFDMTGLYLTLDGQAIKCRPWQKGDVDLDRCRGTSSRFTVATVEARLDAVA